MTRVEKQDKIDGVGTRDVRGRVAEIRGDARAAREGQLRGTADAPPQLSQRVPQQSGAGSGETRRNTRSLSPAENRALGAGGVLGMEQKKVS